tara:strand:- start:7215 stop:7376 length:162 start_codon:yes stop_codon:yes gene_type:complete
MIRAKIAAGNNLNAKCIKHQTVNQRVQVHIDGKLLADYTQAVECRQIGNLLPT